MDFAQLYAPRMLPSHGWLETSMEPSRVYCICGQHQAREEKQQMALLAEEKKITNNGEEAAQSGDCDNDDGDDNEENEIPEEKPNSNTGNGAVTIHIAPFFDVELEGEDEDVSQSPGGSAQESDGVRPPSLVDILVHDYYRLGLFY